MLPINVTSGYRCIELNNAVGGVKGSQHITGCACDIVCCDMSKMIDILKDNPYIDQLLLEHSNMSEWIHVSISSVGTPRRYINLNYRV